MGKNYTIIQDGFKECGSACLLSIIRYYDGNISLEKLLELTNTTKDGTNFYNLANAANQIGLSSKGYKVDDVEKLSKVKTPFISQVVINNYLHFVVIYKIKDNKVTIMDPAKGMTSLSLDEFKKIYQGYILTMMPYKKLPIHDENNCLNNIVIKIIKSNKKIILNILFLTLITIILTCIYSYHFKIIIDNIIDTDKLNLITITIIFMIILVIKLTTEYLRNNLLLYLNQKIDLSIITSTINKIISLPYSYYKNKTTGDVISRIGDLLYFKNIISKLITTIFLDLLLSFIVIIILFHINIKMTMLLIVVTIIYFLIFLIYKNSIKETTNEIQENSANINSLLVESISSYETIKGLNLENKFKNKINLKYLHAINSNLNLTKLVYASDFLKDLFEGIIILFTIYLGLSCVMDKTLTIGNLLTYNTLLYYFLNPIRNSLDFYKELYYVKNSIKRINNILNYKYESFDKESNLPIDGSIYLNNLEFSYYPQNIILKNLSLSIPKKTKMLILGPSGSGKSTLLKLIYKYYDIKRDKLYLGNHDINDYELSDIRKNITYISQNEFLYTDTIKNNIILDRDIKEEEFLSISKLTYVDEIIKNNILGYNFRLEENGANISGGQRQRIILARSLLKESSIILIDEGLNEIDVLLERKILKNIFNYFKNKTIVIVSHRHDNMDLYDQVVTINDGKIKEVLVKND